MIQITLTFTDDLEAALYFANRLGNTGKVTVAQALGATFSAAVTPVEKAAVAAITSPSNTDEFPEPGMEAPGKPSDAPTARSPRTAAAAPSPSAPSVAAPEPKAESSDAKPTAAPAAAPSASAPAEAAFEYATLAKAVNARVAKYGKAALLAIATKHGAGTFKDLPASAWAAAHADVIALGD